MSPKQKFNLSIEPRQRAALEAIEARCGARVSEQIRRAIDRYLETQEILSKAELKKVQKGE